MSGGIAVAIPDKFIVLVGAITAALIAGIVSLVNMMIAKDQKITEFRRAWINSVREQVAKMVAHATTLPFAGRLSDYADSKSMPVQATGGDLVSEQVDRMLDLAKQKSELMDAYNKVLLFLNPAENKKLVSQLAALASAGTIGSKTDQSKINALAGDLLTETQVMLKKEWKRVKRGEWVYRSTKYTIAALVLVMLGMSLYLWKTGNLFPDAVTSKAASGGQAAPSQANPPTTTQH
jgi:hypothetical protein